MGVLLHISISDIIYIILSHTVPFKSLTSVKSFFSWRADEQSTKGTRVVKVAMNWKVI